MANRKKLTAEQKAARGMRVYPLLDVDLTYQNFGSTWLCILRGSSENIDLAFNGLFNWCATNGEYEFFDHAQTVALFWSDRRAIRRFFFNQFFMPRVSGWKGQGKLIRTAMRYAHAKIASLRENSHEQFLDFSRHFMPEIHAMGKLSAENPDSDFKDCVLTHAFNPNRA